MDKFHIDQVIVFSLPRLFHQQCYSDRCQCDCVMSVGCEGWSGGGGKWSDFEK